MRGVTVVAFASAALLAGSIPPAQSQSPGATAPQEQALVPRGRDKPSFDCTRAKTAAARLICADGELARLDGELGAAFRIRKMQMSAPDQSKFGADQLAWIRDRNERCGLVRTIEATIEELAASRPCMISAIRERIAFLVQTDSVAAPKASVTVPVSAHKSWTQITSLTDYAKQIKHRWVKYAEEAKQTSYIDLASIIRTDDTLTVLDMQDWTPPIQVGLTGEYLGSLLSLLRYDCGSTPRSMIMAVVPFHGHMGSGTQQDGAADVPHEPSDGWYVMTARNSDMLKARDMACNAISRIIQSPA